MQSSREARPQGASGDEPPEASPHERAQWPVGRFIALSLFWFGDAFHWTALMSIVLQYQVDRMTPMSQHGTWIAVLFGSGALVSAAVQLLGGWYSDRTRSRWGRRRPFMAAGVFLAVGAHLFMGTADSFTQVVLAWLLIQLTFNLAKGPYQALIPDLVPASLHGTASMWMGIFQHVGQAIGPLVADLILHKPGGIFLLMVIITSLQVVMLLLTLVTVKEVSTLDAPVPDGHWLDAFRVSLRPYPAFTRLLISRLVINMGMYTAMNFLYFYVKYSLGADRPGAIGGLLAMMVVGGLVGGIPVGPLADRFSKVKLIYWCNAVTGLGALLFIATHSYEQARWIGVILGVGFGAFAVVDWALACMLMPRESTARYIGVWSLTATIPQVAAPMVAGPLADLVGRYYGPGLAYRVVLALVLVYLAVGTRLLMGLREPRRGRPEA